MFDPSTSHVIGLSLSVDMTGIAHNCQSPCFEFNKKKSPHESHETAMFLNLQPKNEEGWLETFFVLHHCTTGL